jgi:hypothetical protein
LPSSKIEWNVFPLLNLLAQSDPSVSKPLDSLAQPDSSVLKQLPNQVTKRSRLRSISLARNLAFINQGLMSQQNEQSFSKSITILRVFSVSSQALTYLCTEESECLHKDGVLETNAVTKDHSNLPEEEIDYGHMKSMAMAYLNVLEGKEAIGVVL